MLIVNRNIKINFFSLRYSLVISFSLLCFVSFYLGLLELSNSIVKGNAKDFGGSFIMQGVCDSVVDFVYVIF